MFRLVILCFWITVLAPSLAGQGSDARNPFELTHRLPLISASGTDTIQRGPFNPFNVVKHRAPVSAQKGVEVKEAPTQMLPKFVLPKGKSESKSFLFWALVSVLGFMTFSIAANRSVVGKSWRSFLSENQLGLAHRESNGLLGGTPYFLLYANFLFNAGIFIFLVIRFFKGDDFNNIAFLLVCIAMTIMVFMLKHLLLYVVGWLYPVETETKRYNFLIIVFNCLLGLFLVPFNFMIAFARDFEPFLVFWTMGLIFVFYAYRSLRASLIGRKFLLNSQFHFLLYLCSAEIGPVILLFILAMRQSR